jgi:hypothetical protein
MRKVSAEGDINKEEGRREGRQTRLAFLRSKFNHFNLQPTASLIKTVNT